MIIADLHIHSRFSRATSHALTLNSLEKYARIKGIDLLGTGDFTHPEWIKEIKENLTEKDGILYSKTGFPFVLQTEISLMYSQGGRGRKIHWVILAPSLAVVDKITEMLLKRGRVDYDGRPIFGIRSPEFIQLLKNISEDIEVIPAHAWTPWFGIFGSKSGFDSVEECCQEQSKHIHAIETGLSSDPPMNWRLKNLDKYNLVSNSDAHSFWPWRIGREATMFELKELTYNNLLNSIRTGEGLLGTIEVDPNYGKYHFDGHRNCGVSFSPEEAKQHNNICPVCGKLLTIGVLNRVKELADRSEDDKPDNAKKFYRLLPLSELISAVYGGAVATKKNWEIYNKLIDAFGNEYNILLNLSEEELTKVNPTLAPWIIKNRAGQIKVKAGYDGVYGVAQICNVPKTNIELEKPIEKQASLSDY